MLTYEKYAPRMSLFVSSFLAKNTSPLRIGEKSFAVGTKIKGLYM